MCSTAGLGLMSSAVSMIGTGISSVQSANAYRSYVNNQTAATMSNYEYQTRALNNQYSQEVEQLAQEKQSTYVQNLQAKATAAASAASSGVEGSSIDSLLTGYDRATAVNNYMIDRQLRMKELQYSDKSDALRMSALSSIYGQTSYTNSAWGSTLSSASSLLSSGYEYYKTYK